MKEHIPYNKRINRNHDFEVNYRILTESEGGRKILPSQGIRWDFWYDFKGQHENRLFMILPEFMDNKDQVITKCDVPIPLSGTAKMWIINDDLRRYHKDKIQVGLKGNAHEGETVVANYVVTKIVELMNVE